MEDREGNDIPTVILTVESAEGEDFNYLEWSGKMIEDGMDAYGYKDIMMLERFIHMQLVHLIKMTAKAKDGKVYYMRTALEKPVLDK